MNVSEVDAHKRQFEECSPDMNRICPDDGTTWIRLNVGGKIFTTTRQTLTRECPSFLQKLCQDGCMTSHKDETGAYLIDRDPDYFGPILNYLRHGKLVINPGISEEGVLEEAEFYNLPTLSSMIAERIQERKRICETTCEKAVRSVYRVLQCHQDELTNVVSAMGDGWKIVQVMPNGGFNFSNEGQQEYLCIVVRDFPETSGSVDINNSDRAQHIQQRSRNN